MEKVLNQEEIDAMVRRAGESITAFSTPSSKSSIVSPPERAQGTAFKILFFFTRSSSFFTQLRPRRNFRTLIRNGMRRALILPKLHSHG
jgi:hypothetical protein